ncbi:2-oxo acid dehydrogenase subunit E2 [Amycolatopsis pithecellobii]|uniref:Acyltransferase n=1 Tax=Amycolatopsis pithecellobii TaxID=664692 RepID=A0A6N7Z9W6_9PSEU|nr:2-oxo acid dehydrogenase subunit E2 [Amycolatopsis pithecellobii]MTD58509.1 acyltransferase [Amycolatopsis pithecellobii]
MTAIGPLPRERRHTLRFLEYARSIAPVFLDSEVDMTAVRAHRAASRDGGVRLSWVTYVLYAAGRVLAEHPAANRAISGKRWPRVARYDSVAAKVTLDKTINGERVVFSAVVPGVDTAALDVIQKEVDRFRDTDPSDLDELSGARLLQRLPWPLSALAFRSAARSLRRRPNLMGTVSVTSLGHTAVDSFHSVGGTSVTVGVGRITDRPVVRDDAVTIAPVMRLSLAFDHRVLDGAEAAEVLAGIKETLERWRR